MTLTIDTPCSLSIRPASGDRAPSATLAVLGGSFWFPASALPPSVRDGTYSGASLEMALRTVRVGESSRTVCVPVRLLTLSK